MPIRIKFDSVNQPIEPTIVLARKNGEKICALPSENINVIDSFNSKVDLSFTLHKKRNGIQFPYWNEVTDFKLVWCKDWDKWFEIYVKVGESDKTVKEVTAISLGEAELSQINLYDLEVNTENDIDREDYEPTVFYNPEKPECSLLHRMLDKAPHYSIKHVDSSLMKVQRTFNFTEKNIYDCFQEVAKEIDCIFIFNSGTNEDGTIERSISVYDLKSYCMDCGYRGDTIDACAKCGSTNIKKPYGDDTTVFVSTDNLADSIVYETNTDSVKNCFNLQAGDDLMTATIRSCNPNGSNYIWYISDELKRNMSDELREKLDSYQALYDDTVNNFELRFDDKTLVLYNSLVEKYKNVFPKLSTIKQSVLGYSKMIELYYDTINFETFLRRTMMPSTTIDSNTTAAKELEKVKKIVPSNVAVKNLKSCSLSSATSAVVAYIKTIINCNYQVKSNESHFKNNIWTGKLIITSYVDEEDTIVSPELNFNIVDNYEEYITQRINTALSKSPESGDTITLFKLDLPKFITEIRKYSLTRLNSFRDNCQMILDLMVANGIADRDKWVDKETNLYNRLYEPYYSKFQSIEEEIITRENELAVITGKYDKDGALETPGIQTTIEEARAKVQNLLNFEKHIGEKSWIEFCSYRREDTYKNENYISDGLNNEELIKHAMDFLDTAKKDIVVSSTLQHSISATLKNLLVMKEFLPIVDYFKVGNWIRVKVDDKVYRLRLISYEINFNDLGNLPVEFSDVKIFKCGITDAADLLDKIASMATSFENVSKQADKGDKAHSKLENWVANSLDLTNMRIVGSADNQNMSLDSHGLLGREFMYDTGDYSPKQIKIINRGVYLTDDNWHTSKAGIGDFTYYNPKSGKWEEDYGVIANLIVGNIILSEEVGIYNQNNSVTMDHNGLVITAMPNETGAAKNLLTVQRKVEQDGTIEYEKMLYLDDNGELVLNGKIQINSQNSSSVQDIDGLISNTIVGTTVTYAESTSYEVVPEQGWSNVVPDVSPGNYLWTKTETEYGDGHKVPSYTVSRQGIDGRNSVIIYLYKRSSVQVLVDWRQDLTYSFVTNSLESIPNGWSDSIPDGDKPIFVTAATVSSRFSTDSIAYTEWSAPVVLSQNGADGLNSATIFLYKRSTSTPVKPTKNAVYTFATGKLSETDGWSVGIPSGTAPCYMVHATAVSSSATDTILASEWSAPVVLVKNGENGSSQYIHIKYSDDGATFTANNGNTPGAYIGMYVSSSNVASTTFSDYTWKKFSGDVDADIAELRSLIDANYNDLSHRIDNMSEKIKEQYNQIINETNRIMSSHAADIGQYMRHDKNGLTLGATSSQFKTVIDNSGMYFKQGDTIVSYINNNQLHIPNAVIENTMILGKFFFSPRSDGGVSLTWQGS